MDVFEQAFRLLPDTVIITDVYWYILDFNHAAPFDTIKKGWNLTRVMPDCKALPNDRLRRGGKVYQRSITPVYAQCLHVGYTVYLADITDRENLIEQQRRKSVELEALTQRLAKANDELEEYVRQAEALSDYEEQLRIARTIHDDAGHTITALNTLSQMCLQLGQKDAERYEEMIDEGIGLCENALKAREERRYASLRELEKQRLPVSLVRSVFELRTLSLEGVFSPESAGRGCSPGAVKAMEHITVSDAGGLYAFSVSEEVEKELSEAALRLFSAYTGHHFTSLDILDSVSPGSLR